MERQDFFSRLYPLQDAFAQADTEFRWIEAPPVDQFLGDLRRLGEGLLLLRSW